MALSSSPLLTQGRGTGTYHSMKRAPTSLPSADIASNVSHLALLFHKTCFNIAFKGLDSITGIADNLFVYGSSEVEHYKNLSKLMERAKQKGVVFNKDKVQFKCNKVSFFGHTWMPQGVKPDNKKVSAIIEMKPPEDVKSLQSFLGLVNYLTRYSGRLATLSAPLRDLTKKDTVYSWGPEQTPRSDT